MYISKAYHWIALEILYNVSGSEYPDRWSQSLKIWKRSVWVLSMQYSV